MKGLLLSIAVLFGITTNASAYTAGDIFYQDRCLKLTFDSYSKINNRRAHLKASNYCIEPIFFTVGINQNSIDPLKKNIPIFISNKHSKVVITHIGY